MSAVIELNLRLPSMLHGKKGFDRTVSALKNVFDLSLAWLFYDLRDCTAGSGPIAVHQPLLVPIAPAMNQVSQALVPIWPQHFHDMCYEGTTALLEWLTLVAIQSPRISHDDKIDPLLSRYSAHAGAPATNVTVYRWHAFVPTSVVQVVYLAALKACPESWCALSTAAFDGSAHTILQDKKHTLTWEYED